MKKLFVYGAFVLAMTACKNDKTTTKSDDKSTPSTTSGTSTPSPEQGTTSTSVGWSDMERATFLKQCTDGMTNTMEQSKANDYCACMGEKIETIHPKFSDANNMSEDDMKKLAVDCFK